MCFSQAPSLPRFLAAASTWALPGPWHSSHCTFSMPAVESTSLKPPSLP